jgi:hypothetical protein
MLRSLRFLGQIPDSTIEQSKASSLRAGASRSNTNKSGPFFIVTAVRLLTWTLLSLKLPGVPEDEPSHFEWVSGEFQL